MSTYVSIDPAGLFPSDVGGVKVAVRPLGEEPTSRPSGGLVDVAYALDAVAVRLGVWSEDGRFPCAYLTPVQARAVAQMLLSATALAEDQL